MPTGLTAAPSKPQLGHPARDSNPRLPAKAPLCRIHSPPPSAATATSPCRSLAVPTARPPPSAASLSSRERRSSPPGARNAQGPPEPASPGAPADWPRRAVAHAERFFQVQPSRGRAAKQEVPPPSFGEGGLEGGQEGGVCSCRAEWVHVQIYIYILFF